MATDILPEDYANLGWQLLPCHPHSKIARMPWTLASNNPHKVRWWAARGCDDNWAVVCGPGSGILVVDVENRNGHAELRQLEEQHGERLPAAPRVETGGAGCGCHRYFAWPYGRELRNVRLTENIEVRGHKLLVMVPPSIHPDTEQAYRWLPGYEPWTIAPPAAPEWLLQLMAPLPAPTFKANIGPVSDRYVETVLENLRLVQEGGRNHALNGAAWSLFGRAEEPGPIAEALLAVATEIGLPKVEAVATIRSAANARGVTI